MHRPVINVENLSKEYIIGSRDRANETFREMLTSSLAAPFRRFLKLSGEAAPEERFWALKDVSFEVNEGEVLGIIGRNGAGKSTLLKILSRITEPTKGRVHIRGRVASLLEVGTGFHPELTGRENIYLNGAILGMGRAEIRRKFDEIVEFSGVERFIDTPVKRYSSGMYVRLAFAVGAHLDPEILVVDEVLSVGDAEFQKKCLGEMKAVGRRGKTVLFVSHNMNAIQTLCSKCILMDEGRLISTDQTAHIISQYLSPQSMKQTFVNGQNSDTEAAITYGELLPLTGEDAHGFGTGLKLRVWIRAAADTSAILGVRLKDYLGYHVGFGSLGGIGSDKRIILKKGMNRVSLVLSTKMLAIGRYSISLDLCNPGVDYFHRLEDCITFDINRTSCNGIASLKQEWGWGSVELPLAELHEVEEPYYSTDNTAEVSGREYA